MSKSLRKLILLALGILSVLSVFVGCTEEEPAKVNPESFNSYIDFAKMNGYASPIVLGMKLNLSDNGTLIDSVDNKTVFYTYDNQIEGNNRRAIYHAGKDQFFGVEVLGTGNDKKLQFIFDNNSNFTAFFNNEASVEFDNSNNFINIAPIGADDFIDFVQGAGYTLPDATKVTVSGNSIIETDSKLERFRYVQDFTTDNKTHAIYKQTHRDNLLGVELVATANSRELKFYLTDDNKYFATAETVVFGTPATKLPAKEFLDNVAGYEFQLVTSNEGDKNRIDKLGDIFDGGILDGTGTPLLFKYVEQKSLTTAVYSPKDKPTKYFGVKINDTDNTRLDLYLDNSTVDTGAYWDTKTDVKFESENGVLLATKTINSAFNRTRGVMIGQNEKYIPVTGEISAVSTGTDETLKIHILVSNKDGVSGSLFILKNSELTRTDVANLTSTGITSNSLQAIGDKVFIVHEKDKTITVYDNKSTAITGTSMINNVTDFSIGAGDDTSFYIATKNNGGSVTANLHKVTTAGVQTSVPLATSTMQPKSLIMLGADIYVAGVFNGTAMINKVEGNTSTNITPTGLPNASVTNIKLVAVKDVLYAVVNDTANKIYKFNSTANNWVNVTGTVTLPTDIKSVTTDNTFIYITAGVQNTFNSSAYKFDTDGNIMKVGQDHGIMGLTVVTPSATLLPSMDLFVVGATDLYSDKYLDYNYYKIEDKVFSMP